MAALCQAARSFPDVEEGVACAGTSLECATFKTRRKAFLFVGEHNARLRLQASHADAARLAASEPHRYVVGPQGWVKIFLEQDPDPALLLRWLEESYGVVAKSSLSRRAAPVAKGK